MSKKCFKNISLSTADDNVENNSQLIPLGLEPGTLCVLGARNPLHYGILIRLGTNIVDNVKLKNHLEKEIC